MSTTTPFTRDADFMRSLDPRQREYFCRRELRHRRCLDDAMRGVSRGLGGVHELYVEALAIGLGLENAPSAREAS